MLQSIQRILSIIYHLHTREGADQAQNAWKGVSAMQQNIVTSLILYEFL